MSILISFCTHTSSIKHISPVYISEIHNNKNVFRADSFLLIGNIDSAKYLYFKNLDTSLALSNQYNLLKLVQINYFNRFILDTNTDIKILDSIFSKIAILNKSPFSSLINFYLNKSNSQFNLHQHIDLSNYSKSFQEFFQQSKFFALGEHYKTRSLQLDSSFKYFNYYNLNKEYQVPLIEYYWSKLRLSQLFIYKRDHLTSLSIVNNLIEKLNKTTSIHYIQYILIQKADILYRFDHFNEAEDIVLNILDSIDENAYNMIYQKALKSLLVIYINSKNHLKFNNYKNILVNTVKNKNQDFVNLNKIIGRYYYENNLHDSAIIYQEKALTYSLKYESNDLAALSTLCYIYSESLEKLGYTQKAIKIFLTSVSNRFNDPVKIEDIVDIKRFSDNYYYVILTRLASIYLSDFRNHKINESLNTSNLLARLADSLIQQYLLESNEDKLISFLGENRFIVNLLKEICLIKYQITKESKHLFNYINYYERNRNLIEFTSSNDALNIKLNQLKNKNKRFLLKGLLKDTSGMKWDQTEYEQYNKIINSISNNSNEFANLDQISIRNKLIEDSSMILIFDKVDTAYICILWHADGLKYFQLQSSFVDFITNSETFFLNNKLDTFHILQNQIIPNIKVIISKYQNKLNKILVLQDETFNNLNLEWLPFKSQEPNIQYVIQKYLVVYVNSISSYIKKSNSVDSIKSIIGCFWTDENTLSSTTCLAELPGSIKERQLISNYFTMGKYISGLDFTKANLINMIENKSWDIFHLSSHVSSNTQLRDDIKIYLRSKDEEIDSMFAFELISPKVNIKNAVLVSCETGIGKSLPTQSAFTLANYFLKSGAKYVVSSTRKLSDKQSARFCEKFYMYLDINNKSFAEAYRNAKLELFIEQKGSIENDFQSAIRLFF